MLAIVEPGGASGRGIETAELLCRMGVANLYEMQSLVRRTESFPTLLRDDEKPEQFFDSGLGMARWYFTKLDYRKALIYFRRKRIGFPYSCRKSTVRSSSW